MEIWILIFPLLAIFWIGAAIIEIYENYQFNKTMRNRHMKELRRAAREKKPLDYYSLEEIRKFLDLEGYKTSGVKTILPTGEEQTLRPGKVYFFGGPKVGTVTGTSLLCNEELEEMGAILDEAERLIKEARDRTVD